MMNYSIQGRRPRAAAALPGLLCAALALASPAAAQNTSGVSGPVVKPGERAVEYRMAFRPEGDGFAHRLHYQQSFGTWRGRIIVTQSNSGPEGLEFRSVKLEVLKQFVRSDGDGWNSAVRFDGKVPVDGDGPGLARVAWLNSVDFAGGWQARGNIYLGREIGDFASDGLTLETRAEATREIRERLRLGAQLFSDFNTTAAPGDFDEQSHQIGPVLKYKTNAGLKFELSALFGASRTAPDADLRLFVGYSF